MYNLIYMSYIYNLNITQLNFQYLLSKTLALLDFIIRFIKRAFIVNTQNLLRTEVRQ